MSNILTPVSLWKNFDDTLPVQAEITGESTEDGIKTQYLSFYGRETGAGRVKIYAAFAQDMRESCHRILYAVANYSAAMNGFSETTRVIRVYTWIEILITTLDIVFAVLAAGSLAMLLVSKIKERKK